MALLQVQRTALKTPTIAFRPEKMKWKEEERKEGGRKEKKSEGREEYAMIPPPAPPEEVSSTGISIHGRVCPSVRVRLAVRP